MVRVSETKGISKLETCLMSRNTLHKQENIVVLNEDDCLEQALLLFYSWTHRHEGDCIFSINIHVACLLFLETQSCSDLGGGG